MPLEASILSHLGARIGRGPLETKGLFILEASAEKEPAFVS
jgi:hypothetical protein